MSDEINRAIDARMASFMPQDRPSFATLERRGLRRRQQRQAAFLAVPVLLVSSVVGFVGVNSSGQERLPGYAAPTTGPTGAGDVTEPAAADVEPYSLSEGGRSLTVAVAVGGGCDVTGVATAGALETPDQVTVEAKVTRPSPVSTTAAPKFCPTDVVTQRVTLRLDAPLGGRRVVDAATGRALRPNRP